MRRKIKIEIVTGFLSSGKTSFINYLVGKIVDKGCLGDKINIYNEENTTENAVKHINRWSSQKKINVQDITSEGIYQDKFKNLYEINGKTVILQYEKGQREISENIKLSSNIIIKFYESGLNSTEEYIEKIINEYNPIKIIIEQNGTVPLTETLEVLNSNNIRKYCKIISIYYISDASTFNAYLNNMSGMILPSIQYSNFILINNADSVTKEEFSKINKNIDYINPNALIQTVKKDEKIESSIKKEKPINKEYIFAGFLLVLILTIFRIDPVMKFKVNEFQNFFIIFISIILEALPFIFIGAFVASLIQIYITDEFISKILPKNRLIAYMGAALMGLIFPVCECAIVPITRKLIKKGVPSGVAITFMLAVPIINPVVIASTYYAFNNNPLIVILRCICGFIIACTIGFLVDIKQDNRDDVLLESDDDYLNNDILCSCGGWHVKSDKLNNKFTLNGFRNVLEHTSREFQAISKYLIMGAFISTIFQGVISKNFIFNIGLNSKLSIIIMMILAFLLSICSEADAFIAKPFLGQFTTGAVVGFLVLGPMVDVKNALMLFGNFKKKFTLRIIMYIFVLVFLCGTIVNFMGN